MVNARLLVLGIANLVGLCGERIKMERFLLLSIGMFSGRAHSMCLLLSCISLTLTAVHFPCVDGLHGHGNASFFLGQECPGCVAEVHVVWVGQLVLLFHASCLLVFHKTHEHSYAESLCYPLKLWLEYYACSLLQGLLFPVPSLCIG